MCRKSLSISMLFIVQEVSTNLWFALATTSSWRFLRRGFHSMAPISGHSMKFHWDMFAEPEYPLLLWFMLVACTAKCAFQACNSVYSEFLHGVCFTYSCLLVLGCMAYLALFPLITQQQTNWICFHRINLAHSIVWCSYESQQKLTMLWLWKLLQLFQLIAPCNV